MTRGWVPAASAIEAARASPTETGRDLVIAGALSNSRELALLNQTELVAHDECSTVQAHWFAPRQRSRLGLIVDVMI